MAKKLEIYVRNSTERSLLMLHIPARSRNNFLDSLKRGEFAEDDLEMNLELTIRPEWISDPIEREKFVFSGNSIHIRIPLSAITTSYSNEDE